MPPAELHDYLSRLGSDETAAGKLWRDSEGRIQGKFFNCSLTSLFQPVRTLDGEVQAFDAHAHSYSKQDRGLSVWKLLNSAASDEESIELDRLCRMLHVLNFFRQIDDPHSRVVIGVHERLLAAVSGNHGAVFRRIVDGLQLPVERIMLQLPPSGPGHHWVTGFVVDNYRANGFRIATHAGSADEASRQLDQLRPDLIRIDARAAGEPGRLADLIEHAGALDVQLMFARVDADAELLNIIDAVEYSGSADTDHLWIQGALAGAPEPSLATTALRSPRLVRPERELPSASGSAR